MRHPSVEGWRRNARHRGTLLGKRQLRALLLVSSLEPIFEEDAIEARFFSKRECHRGTGARWLACGNLEQAAEGRVIGVVVPLGSFRRRPVSVVRSLSVSSGCARLGHPRTTLSAAFLASRLSRNSLKNQKRKPLNPRKQPRSHAEFFRKQPRIFTEEARISTEGPCESVAVSVISAVAVGVVAVVRKKKVLQDFLGRGTCRCKG